MAKRPPKPLWHPANWPTWLLLGTLWLITRLPYRTELAIGRGLGMLVWWLVPSRRHIVRVNLQLCFPEKSEAEREALAKDHLRAVGMGIIEMAMCWWWSEPKLQALAHYEGLDHLRTAKAQGKGVLLLSAHFTTLEMGGRLLTMEEPMAAMYRPHKNPVINWAMSTFRGKLAAMAIPRQDVRGMLRALKDGHSVWYAADQSKKFKYTTLAPFFGEPCITNTATARFAKISGAAVVPFFMFRRSDGKGYDIQLLPPLENYPAGDELADATTMNDVIKTAVLRAPEQYFWIHRRFKNRGPDYPNPY